MPLPSSINDLSTTAGSNSPAGSESPSLIDDYLRTYASYIAQLRDGAQNNGFTYAAAGGSANAITATYSPLITTLSDSTVLLLKAASANTGATTFSPNGLTAKPIVDMSHSALQGGEIVANGDVCLQYNTSVGGGSWVLIYSSGVAVQTPVVAGSVRNLKMSITAASASGTLTADEIIVKTALGSYAKVLSSFSKTINLATTGAGGMDTGAAPVSGYVALYAIYNPATATSSILAFNSTSSTAPEVYGGANMPSGYTASALLAVVPTNASSQFKVCIVRDRSVFVIPAVLFTNNSTVTNQVVSISGVVPQNARNISGQFFMSSTITSAMNLVIQPDTTTIAQLAQSIVVGASAGMITTYALLPLITAQQFVVTTSSSAGAPTFTVYCTGYSI